MATLQDLLRYKRAVEIKDETGKSLMTVWARVLGDMDMQEAYRRARVASMAKREALHDETSIDYIDEISALKDAAREDCLRAILASKSSNFTAQAISANSRDELPTLKDIAVDPDAPTLEEQERVEYEKVKRELEYQNKLDDYVKTKSVELEESLKDTPLDELRIMAKEEAANILALTAFVNTLNDEKTWRAIYLDEACKQRAFNSVVEFNDLHMYVKDQLIEAYRDLEVSPDEIKN